jgi:hypothetical protein
MKSLCAIGMLLGAVGIEAFLLNKSNAPISVRPDLPVAHSSVTSKPSFDSDIKPIFQARCQPCHFPEGKVYDKLPFDNPATITKLGTKLFTRIKDEKEQRLIREFLEAKN